MMLSYFLLAVLAVSAVSADEHPKTLCGNIQAQKDVSIDSLKGNWVAVETVGFVDGQPTNSANLAEDKRSKTCLYSKSSEVTDSGLVIKTDAHYPGKDTVVETSTLTSLDSTHARFSIHSDIQERENWEFMVIDSNPSKYLVYLLCQPPNEAGERLPERVNLMSRHGDHEDHEAINADEIAEVERNLGTKLGISGRGIKPVKYSHDCWASYGEK